MQMAVAVLALAALRLVVKLAMLAAKIIFRNSAKMSSSVSINSSNNSDGSSNNDGDNNRNARRSVSNGSSARSSTNDNGAEIAARGK